MLKRRRAGRSGTTGRGLLIEEGFGGTTARHCVRDLIGVTFIWIIGTSNAAFQVDAAPLLDDVGGLMSGEPKVGRRFESHRIAHRVGMGLHAGICGFGGAADLRPSAG